MASGGNIFNSFSLSLSSLCRSLRSWRCTIVRIEREEGRDKGQKTSLSLSLHSVQKKIKKAINDLSGIERDERERERFNEAVLRSLFQMQDHLCASAPSLSLSHTPTPNRSLSSLSLSQSTTLPPLSLSPSLGEFFQTVYRNLKQQSNRIESQCGLSRLSLSLIDQLYVDPLSLSLSHEEEGRKNACATVVYGSMRREGENEKDMSKEREREREREGEKKETQREEETQQEMKREREREKVKEREREKEKEREGERSGSSDQVAVKLYGPSLSLSPVALEELHRWASLRYPGVCRVIGWVRDLSLSLPLSLERLGLRERESERVDGLVLPLYPGGSLSSLLGTDHIPDSTHHSLPHSLSSLSPSLPSSFSLSDKISLSLSIATTLNQLHTHDRGNAIVHGAIRGSNILLDKQLRPYLTDIGLWHFRKEVVMKSKNYNVNHSQEAIRWSAPELLEKRSWWEWKTRGKEREGERVTLSESDAEEEEEVVSLLSVPHSQSSVSLHSLQSANDTSGGQPTTKSDVYSFGALLCEIFEERVPFSEVSVGSAQTRKQRGKYPLFTSRTPKVVVTIAQSCMRCKPRDRPLMSEVVLMLRNALQEVGINDLEQTDSDSILLEGLPSLLYAPDPPPFISLPSRLPSSSLSSTLPSSSLSSSLPSSLSHSLPRSSSHSPPSSSSSSSSSFSSLSPSSEAASEKKRQMDERSGSESAKKEKTRVDLSGHDISFIPTWLADSSGLKELYLSNNSQLSSLSPLSGVDTTSLLILDISHTNIKDLTPLVYCNLTSLVQLHIQGTPASKSEVPLWLRRKLNSHCQVWRSVEWGPE